MTITTICLLSPPSAAGLAQVHSKIARLAYSAKAAPRLLTMMAFAVLISACGTQNYRNNLSMVANGPALEFEKADIEKHRINQDAVLSHLFVMAGQSAQVAPSTGLITGTVDWDKVVNAGIDYADYQCEMYMHSLFRLNRDKTTIMSEIGLLGTASVAVMAAVKSAAREVALTAVAFGLANSTVETLSNNVLYTLEPSSVRTLVRSLHVVYRDSLRAGYSTRPAALNAIRGYATLCTPSNIEAEVNLAVKKSQPLAVTKGDASTGQAPVVTNAATGIVTKNPDEVTSELLLNALFPKNVVNEVLRAKVEAYLVDKKLNVGVNRFLLAPEFAKERAEVATKFELNKTQ